MRKSSVGGLIVSAVLLSTSSLALATTTEVSGPPDSITDWATHTRDTDLSVMLWLPWYYGFGVGGVVRYEIPIVPDGFIPHVNDEFSLEPNIGIAASGCCGESWITIAPALYGTWSFNFSKEFRAYATLGLGYSFGVYSGAVQGLGYNYFFWDLAAGIFYRWTNAMAFRAELGSQGLKAGISFFF